MAPKKLTSTPWAIEEDIFISLSREAPLNTPSRTGGFKKFAERLNDFLRDNGFTHTRMPAEVKNRYTYKRLKKPNIHQLGKPDYTHSRYREVQDWMADSDNAAMLEIVRAAIVA